MPVATISVTWTSLVSWTTENVKSKLAATELAFTSSEVIAKEGMKVKVY